MSTPPQQRWDPQQRTQRLPGRPERPKPGQRPPNGRPPRRSHRYSRAALAVLAIVLLLVVLGGAYLYSRFTRFGDKVYVQPPPGSSEDVRSHDITSQPFNLLLVGVDYRSAEPSEGARSDTLILVHVDPVNKWSSMLSVPRDSIAYIPRIETTEKINAAYSYGYLNAEQLYGPGTPPDAAGVYLARETIEQFLKLDQHGTKIHYQAQIDFEGFKRIIDAVGGVNVDVPLPLMDPEYPSDDGDYGYLRLFIPAGLQHMDGVTALRYARSRHADSDFGRSARQQQVLRAILASMKDRGVIDQIIAGDEIVTVLEESLRTDLPVKDPGAVRALASLGKTMAGDRIQSYSMNDAVAKVEEGGAIFWDEADLNTLVAQWLRGPAWSQTPGETAVPTAEPARQLSIQVLNGTGVTGLAGEISTKLSTTGLDVLSAANADRMYEHTLLLDYGNSPTLRQQIARCFGLDELAISVRPQAGPPNELGADMILVLGKDYSEDWRSGSC